MTTYTPVQLLRRVGLDPKTYRITKHGALKFKCAVCDKFHNVMEMGDRH